LYSAIFAASVIKCSVSQSVSKCPNKQSDSDPIPTWLLKECGALLVPTVTNIVS